MYLFQILYTVGIAILLIFLNRNTKKFFFRLLASKVFDLPLSLQELTSVEDALKGCAIELYAVKQASSYSPKVIPFILASRHFTSLI